MISKARRGEFRGTVARASGAATSRNPEAPPPFFPKLSQNWPPSSVSQHLRNEKRQPTARYLSLVPKSRPYSGLVSGSVSGPFASIFDEWSARRRQGWVRTERAPQIKLGVPRVTSHPAGKLGPYSGFVSGSVSRHFVSAFD